ncbi:unnamed protein product [marine sediment metagenome]|uniref:ParB-like N-terminal domain-containing protein n=1 Tax=marine sediment metagenome TaxID=412755 RepID=X1JLT5_9ZZZZ
MQTIESIPINTIEVGQHRQRSEGEDEEIQELAASIKRVGVLEPIIVRRLGDSILLVAGHRRIAAAQAAGLAEIPAIVRESNQAEAAEISFAENFFRRDLSPVEQAMAIRGCIDDKIMTIEELAKGLHKKERWVCEQAQMTTWPDEVLQAITSSSTWSQTITGQVSSYGSYSFTKRLSYTSTWPMAKCMAKGLTSMTQ